MATGDMVISLARDLNAAISRAGRRVPLWVEETTGADGFGQPTANWVKKDEVLAMRSYQNRNTSSSASSGELHRNRAVFFFSRSASIPADARIRYDGKWFELDSPTEQLTHTVAVGSIVQDDTFSP